MFESLSRAWALTKTSFHVLKLDKEILVLPLLAAVTMIVAVVGLGFGAFGLLATESTGALGLVALFAVYVVAWGIAIFFNAAVIEMATIRFNGGDPTLKDGLRKSWSRVGRIFQWALVAATVGLIFHILRDQAKDNFLARLLISFLETGWTVAAFFAVPVAIYQDVGPFQALRGSIGTVKRGFGETVGTMVTTSLIFLVFGIVGAVVLFLAYLATGLLMPIIVVGVLFFVALAAVNSAVDGIAVAALYKYANEGVMPRAFAEKGVQGSELAW